MHMVVRVAVAILMATWFLLFAVPIPANVLNVGNVTGMAVCAVVFAYMLFFKTANCWIAQLWQHRAWKCVLIILAVLVVVAIVLAIVITVCMLSASANQSDGSVTVVVLGCKVNGETPSLTLRDRLDAATAYLNAHPEVNCVVSGGQGEDEAISEAECMKRYLLAKGIAEDRIYMEDRSTSTRENLLFSQQVIAQNGLEPAIAIVTNEYHQYRSAQIAKALNMTAYAVPAKTPIWLFPTYYVREMLAILYEWIF